jgi:hypothetical protein
VRERRVEAPQIIYKTPQKDEIVVFVFVWWC